MSSPPNCSNWGTSGSNVPLPDLVTTSGTLTCFISGFTQTGNTITVSVFATGNTTALATISGGGGGGALKAMSTGSFSLTANSTYYVTFTSSNGQTPQVFTNYDALTYGTTTYVGSYVLTCEDTPNGGDCDFNDAVVNISWTLFAG